MKKIGLLALILLSVISGASAQFGLSGGVSMLKGFGGPKPYVGLHISGEIPRDDYNSFFARVSFYGKQWEDKKNISNLYDMNEIQTAQFVSYNNSMNYTVIEGGNRFYIGDGYDNGFGAYGGGTFQGVFNSVHRKYADYDMLKYQLGKNENSKGSIFSIAVGLNGGLKYTIAGVGTVYFDTGFSYVILKNFSNYTAQSVVYDYSGYPISPSLYSHMFFSFGLGFRKEFY